MYMYIYIYIIYIYIYIHIWADLSQIETSSIILYELCHIEKSILIDTELYIYYPPEVRSMRYYRLRLFMILTVALWALVSVIIA